MDDSYACHSFAGYFSIVEGYSATFADFGVLPGRTHFLTHLDQIKKDVSGMEDGKTGLKIPVVSCSQMKAIEDSLKSEIEAVGRVYGKLFQCAVKIMRTHARGVLPQWWIM